MARVARFNPVITVDTSIAQLAGAVGKTAGITLPRVADRRWMEERNTSPRRLSGRLFRQSATGDWASVVRQIAEALRDWAQ
ncbi:MAG TPA: hypothetical protein VME86_12265 [Acidobacteriaceae bacterium]|nr:hypothetical protein [Acidobacteriaceae bacterium]